MTARDALRVLAEAFPTPDGPPDPETASEEEIAEFCGVRPATAPPDAVPVESYRSQGRVACERTGRTPAPPWLVVARYSMDLGESEILSHEAYADELASQYPRLTGLQAEVLALHRAGWLEPDWVGLDTPLGGDKYDGAEALSAAKEIVDR